MRHYFTVEYFDEAKHAWVVEDNSSNQQTFMVFDGDKEPCVGEQISVSHTEPVIVLGKGLEIEPSY